MAMRSAGGQLRESKRRERSRLRLGGACDWIRGEDRYI